MNENNKRIEKIICEFVKRSNENSMKNSENEPAWEEVLIGYSSGADSIFNDFKEHVGEFHFTPLELFKLTFPGIKAQAEEIAVISWVLPQTEKTKADNRVQTYYPSERWARSRTFGDEFNILLRKHIVEQLEKINVQALAPQLSPHWGREQSPRYGFASRWSERHAAFACGLGTFGLCDGLITARGKAHRLGSIIARIDITPTTRPYKNHHEYCLYFSKGKCTACIERCPVGAISDHGHDKIKCKEHVHNTSVKYIENEYGIKHSGCGLCQTNVPCESKIP